jgi:WD40 repeat protein
MFVLLQTQVWDSRTGTLRQSLATHEADVLALAVSADEGTVFGSGVDNKVSAVQFIKGTQLSYSSIALMCVLNASVVHWCAM